MSPESEIDVDGSFSGFWRKPHDGSIGWYGCVEERETTQELVLHAAGTSEQRRTRRSAWRVVVWNREGRERELQRVSHEREREKKK